MRTKRIFGKRIAQRSALAVTLVHRLGAPRLSTELRVNGMRDRRPQILEGMVALHMRSSKIEPAVNI